MIHDTTKEANNDIPQEAQEVHRDFNTEGVMGGAYDGVYNPPLHKEKTIGQKGDDVSRKYVLNKNAKNKILNSDSNGDIASFINDTTLANRLPATLEEDAHRFLTKNELTNESQKILTVDNFYENEMSMRNAIEMPKRVPTARAM